MAASYPVVLRAMEEGMEEVMGTPMVMIIVPANTREAEKKGDAIRILQDAIHILQDACGGRDSDKLQKALCLIQVPCAKGAALALKNIMEVAARCDDADALGAVKAAERTTRDVVVLRCHASVNVWALPWDVVPQDGPWDSERMLDAAELAFGHPLSRDLKAALCLSFHKLRPATVRPAKAKAKANARPAMAKANAKAEARPATARHGLARRLGGVPLASVVDFWIQWC